MRKPVFSRAALRRFIAIRERSPFDSNLQFAFDAASAGFNLDALGDATPYMPPGVPDDAAACLRSYRWVTPWGELHEQFGKLELREPRDDC